MGNDIVRDVNLERAFIHIKAFLQRFASMQLLFPLYTSFH